MPGSPAIYRNLRGKRVLLVIGYAAMTTKNTSKMTLYEVTNKVAKINGKKAPDVEKLPETAPKPEKINKKFKMPLVVPNTAKKPSPLKRQLKRINRQVRPYYKVIWIVAAIILVWVGISYLWKDKPNSLGETTPSQGSEPRSVLTHSPGEPVAGTDVDTPEPPITDPPVLDPVLDVHASTPSDPEGDHVIVLASDRSRNQLLPVKEFFDQNGFQTVIERKGTMYVLMTVALYMNPDRPENDGYAAKQKLMEIGSRYKPPEGYLRFYFKDIYGMKVK